MDQTAEVVVTQSADVAHSIGVPGLMEARLAAVGSEAAVVREPGARLDVIAQRLAAQGEIPTIDVPEGIAPWFATQFTTQLGGPNLALGVLSVRDELVARVWRHRTEGFLVQPPPNLEVAWNETQRGWLESSFEPTPAPSADQSREALRSVAALAAKPNVLVVFNVSTYDPGGVRHDFAHDVYTVLAHRLDLMLERVAADVGFAVIDVDRSVAEFGGARAVTEPATYADEASAVIAEDAFTAIDELGLEGMSLSGDVMRLDVPAYDRRTTVGRIDAWHVAPGADVERGAPLFDLTFANLVHRLDYAARKTNRSMSLTVLAAGSGRIAAVAVGDGTEVAVGQTVGVVTKDASVQSPDITELQEGAPPFRVGIRVK